eukprot:jgi/Tetstr1/422999/TSEL_013775.t1
MLIYLRRVKCTTGHTGEGRVAKRLINNGFFDIAASECSISNGVDPLLNAVDNKRLEVSLHQAAKAYAVAHLGGAGGGGGGGGGGGAGGGSGGNRLKERAEGERADMKKVKDKDKGAGKGIRPQPGDRAKKTPTPEAEQK